MTLDLFATIFVTALELSGPQRLMLMWPLCLAVAIVYKATRCEDVRQIPKATVVLWGTIIMGMYAVGVGLWALFNLLA